MEGSKSECDGRGQLCPFGHCAGNLFEIEDASVGIVAYQRSTALEFSGLLRMTAGQSSRGHAAAGFFPFDLIK